MQRRAAKKKNYYVKILIYVFLTCLIFDLKVNALSIWLFLIIETFYKMQDLTGMIISCPWYDQRTYNR